MEKYNYKKVKYIMEDKTLTKIQIAKELNISRPTLDKWIMNVKKDDKFLKENCKGNMVLSALTKTLKNEHEKNRELSNKVVELESMLLSLKLNCRNPNIDSVVFIDEIKSINSNWKSIYKKGSKYFHPDRGGDIDLFRVWKILDDFIKSN